MHEFLREKRIKAGLTQYELAKILNYTSAQHISNMERGKSPPPVRAAKPLIKALNISEKQYKRHIMKFFEKRIDKALSKKDNNERTKRVKP